MPVSLSIKHVPDELAERLRRRAATHHRSLQGELLAMLEEHLAGGGESLTLAQVFDLTRTSGLRTPSQAVAIICADRSAVAARRQSIGRTPP
jgi:plasmid stability protein